MDYTMHFLCEPMSREVLEAMVNRYVDCDEDYLKQYNAVLNVLNILKQQIEACKFLGDDKEQLLSTISELSQLLLSSDLKIRNVVFKHICSDDNIKNMLMITCLIKNLLGKANIISKEFFINFIASQLLCDDC